MENYEDMVKLLKIMLFNINDEKKIDDRLIKAYYLFLINKHRKIIAELLSVLNGFRSLQKTVNFALNNLLKNTT